jgi:hypothetical protein
MAVKPTSWITAVHKVRAARTDVGRKPAVQIADAGGQDFLHRIVDRELIVELWIRDTL